MSSFFQIMAEEIAYTEMEAWVKKNIPPVVAVLESEGVLDIYLGVASHGGSIWRSALPRGVKTLIKETLTSNESMVEQVQRDPERFMTLVLTSLPDETREKVFKSTTKEYWVGQMNEILKSLEG